MQNGVFILTDINSVYTQNGIINQTYKKEYKMNKTIITLIGFLAIMFFSGNVYAGDFGSASVGAAVTIADTAATSDALVFTPSPGIIMGGETAANTFTIVSGNTKATSDAIVVGLTSSTPIVYQIAQDLTSITTGAALTGADTVAGSVPSGFKERN